MPLILNCLVQFSVILIALAALPTAIAKAGDECSFEKTVLSPAAKNPCFQKLVEKAMDLEDRKWLMYLSRSWNPDPSLKVAMVPGGIVVFKKDKKILDARWIYANPLVLVWNEKVIISAGELKTKSVFKFLNEFIDQPSSHATNFTLFPEAFAKEPSDDEVVKDLFTLYTFNYSDKLDAESLIRE
ncbi:MAG: hypothetical protein ACXVA9_06585, partial [Bdellovibrionales bacterium]